jgi:hypothetical protein
MLILDCTSDWSIVACVMMVGRMGLEPRPEVQGGADWRSTSLFYEHVFGCKTASESVARVCQALEAADEGNGIIVVSHNGPAGLGSNSHDICGVDFQLSSSDQSEPSGDWGDPDLQQALESFQANGRFDSLPHQMDRGTSRLMATILTACVLQTCEGIPLEMARRSLISSLGIS